MTQPTPTATDSVELETTFEDASLEMNGAGDKFRVGLALQNQIAANTSGLASTQASLTAHQGAGGAAHAVATTGVAGFLSSADKTKLDALAAGQAASVGRLTVDAVLEVPTNIAYAAAVTLDAAVKNDYAIGVLTGPCAITWSNPAAGRQGTVAVRQDGTGSRAVTLTAPGGWTLMRDSVLADLAAAQAANAITLYTWAFVAVGGAQVLLCSKLVGA